MGHRCPRQKVKSKGHWWSSSAGSQTQTAPRQDRRQRGCQWCPAPPFEIGSPHFTFDSPVTAYIQYCISKIWPPLLVFGSSFWFLAPSAAKSWWLACSEGQMRTYEVTRGPHYDYPYFSRATLWRLRNNGGSLALLETAFTSYFLRKVTMYHEL